MFYPGMIERSTPRDQWYKLYSTLRKYGEWYKPDDWLEHRAELKARIARNTENGLVALVESGRDCDCVEYCHSWLHNHLTPYLFDKIVNDTHSWADGPVHIGMCKPSERPEAYSRDLALEAHEDGHPHVVSSVRFESYD